MNEEQLRKNCEALAAVGCAKSAAVLILLDKIAALETELEGEKKANALLCEGMGRVSDLYNQLKHENRRLKQTTAGVV